MEMCGWNLCSNGFGIVAFFVAFECEKVFGCLILMLHVVGQNMDSLLIILQAIVIDF
jgi:hypothetical protein